MYISTCRLSAVLLSRQSLFKCPRWHKLKSVVGRAKCFCFPSSSSQKTLFSICLRLLFLYVVPDRPSLSVSNEEKIVVIRLVLRVEKCPSYFSVCCFWSLIRWPLASFRAQIELSGGWVSPELIRYLRCWRKKDAVVFEYLTNLLYPLSQTYAVRQLS